MKSPYESIFHLPLDYKFLKTFGCSCFHFLRNYSQYKFHFNTSKCIFLGYNPLYKGYMCLHPSGKIYVTSHVILDETSFPYSSISVHLLHLNLLIFNTIFFNCILFLFPIIIKAPLKLIQYLHHILTTHHLSLYHLLLSPSQLYFLSKHN